MVGRLLNKVVVLTPENGYGVPLFSFDSETTEENWFVEPVHNQEQRKSGTSGEVMGLPVENEQCWWQRE